MAGLSSVGKLSVAFHICFALLSFLGKWRPGVFVTEGQGVRRQELTMLGWGQVAG